MVSLKVMNPRAERRLVKQVGLSNPRMDDLNGKKIALLCVKGDSSVFFDCVQELLSARYPKAEFLRFQSLVNPLNPDNSEEIAAQCDCWLEGVKTSGDGNRDSGVRLESLGKPGVSVSCDGLVKQLRRLVTNLGMPTLRITTVPAEKFFASENSRDNLMPLAESVIDELITGLTAPLTEEEMNPKPEKFDFGPMTFEGETYTDALEKFQQYWLDLGIGDALPLVPPTEEAVEWMLTGTTRDRKEVLGVMYPGDGYATVEKVAINAVMAGAKPEYLPVIMAAVEVMCDPGFNLCHINTGTLNSQIIMWVNGPIAKEIGLNGGMCYLGPGHRANSTIGRALSLCMMNIGWALLDVEGGLLGQPGRYCNLVFAENEEASPWNSFSVIQGYDPQDSVVTLDECIDVDRDGPMGAMGGSPLEKDMDALARMLTGLFAPLRANKNEPATRPAMPKMIEHSITGRYCELAIYPTTAIQLAKRGFTKESFTQWLCDQHRIPWEDFGPVQQKELLAVAEEGSVPGLTVEDCRPGGTIPTYDPRHVALIVAGDTAGRNAAFRSGAAANVIEDMLVAGAKEGQHWCSRKITGAALTKAGR